MFAMARYYRGRSENLNSTLGFQHLEKAVQLADRASDRERLIIRAAWGWGQSDPGTLAIADTLAARYPQEPEAHLWAARALQEAANYPAALRRLRQVVALDSSAHRESTPICTVCDARGDLVIVLMNMDSLGAAERESHTWTRLEPRSAAAWRRLAETLGFLGKFDEAREAQRRAVELDRHLGEPVNLAYLHFLEGDYETLDRELREQTLAAAPEMRAEALWYLTISLRRQGRLAEALDASNKQRSLMLEIQPDRSQLQYAYQVSQVLFELGRYPESAALFDSIAAAQVGFTPSMRARYQAWPLSLAANGYAAAGDTAALAARIDAIRAFGAQSLLARDQKLHHHVRALLLLARGEEDEAIAELRRAILPGLAYTRTNYELARLLLNKRRPAEAVKVLQPALHSVEGSSLYITRTELEELLARAWEAAGSRDSALVHYRAVATAWQRADPILRGRLDAVLARVSELESR
jgi:tetratricopeptide (TPR) repeat protein